MDLNTGGTSVALDNLYKLLAFGNGSQIVDVIHRFTRGSASSSTDLDFVTCSPHYLVIRNSRNPLDFKLPVLDPYDGRKGPTTHLMRYIRHMEVLSPLENVMAKFFSFYLPDITTMWFRKLEVGFITS